MTNKYKLKKNVVSSLLTFIVIFSLILSGPASAVTVTIASVADVVVDGGRTISGSIDIEAGEVIPVEGIRVDIDGVTCDLNIDGSTSGALCTKLSSQSISVDAGSSYTTPGTGYGYGTTDSGATFADQSLSWTGYGYGPVGVITNEVTFSVVYTPNASDIGAKIVAVDLLTGDATEYPRSETTQSFSVTAASSSSGGSSSSTTTLLTLPPSDEDDGEPVNATLTRKDKVKFDFDGEEHTVTMKTIRRDTVDVVVASTPTTYTLGEGETAQKDLDDDGDMDLEILVKEIVPYRSAVVEMKQLSEAPPAIVYEDPVVTRSPADSTVSDGDTTTVADDGDAMGPKDSAPEEETGSSLPMTLVYILLGIAVIAAAIVGFKKKGNK